MDGYAIDWESSAGAEEDSPVKLKIVGEVKVGSRPGITVGKGEAAYISTGAMIPRGADSVIMVEYTSRSGSTVDVYRSVAPGENIAHAGSDFFYGEVLANRMKRVTPEHIALFASTGIDKVKMLRKLKIGIFSTGDELMTPGNSLNEGMIFDSNSYFFKGVLESIGQLQVEILGKIEDDEDKTIRFLQKNLEAFDVLISSGSTSAGFHDLLYRVTEKLGGHIVFHGISIKPGKPTFLARFRNSLLIGMPGFPLSAAAVLYYLVVPAFQEALSMDRKRLVPVKLAFRINSEKGKDTIIPAIIGRSGRAYPILGESGSFSRVVYADGLLVIPGSRNFYDRDERVKFLRLKNEKRDLLCIGSNDPFLERILFDSSSNPTIVNAGSWGGVKAMEMGEADVAGIHLLRDEEYNRFVMSGDLRENAVLIRGFSRVQGIISTTGVSSMKEIVDRDLLFVNRNAGSGTRDLIDFYLESELGKEFRKERIRGYFWEARSHAAVARSVKQHRADAGVSIEFYSKLFSLDFKPLREEDYDILASKDFLRTATGRRFVDRLKNSSRYLSDFPGYHLDPRTGEIIN